MTNRILSPIPETVHTAMADAHIQLSAIKTKRSELVEERIELERRMAAIDRVLGSLHEREARAYIALSEARLEARRAALASGSAYNTQFEL